MLQLMIWYVSCSKRSILSFLYAPLCIWYSKAALSCSDHGKLYGSVNSLHETLLTNSAVIQTPALQIRRVRCPCILSIKGSSRKQLWGPVSKLHILVADMFILYTKIFMIYWEQILYFLCIYSYSILMVHVDTSQATAIIHSCQRQKHALIRKPKYCLSGSVQAV